jgi:hypothetical protein
MFFLARNSWVDEDYRVVVVNTTPIILSVVGCDNCGSLLKSKVQDNHPFYIKNIANTERWTCCDHKDFCPDCKTRNVCGHCKGKQLTPPIKQSVTYHY